ncbi:MAG: class I SAM-dependent rRNA methyltransferase [Chlorobiales bacterium]|nr:class I SAM-dependent rRNA methyltransferase [Chlorobiales bacterium]
METISLKKNEERRILNGHQWVFSNELQEVPKHIASGTVVRLHSGSGRFLGIGFFNAHSLISFRVLSAQDEKIGHDFFERRLLEAAGLRERLYPESISNAWRLIHSESDRLPGLIIDRFGSSFSIQTFSAGMELHLDMICEVLQKLYAPKAIVIRNESKLRELEGLDTYKRTVFGDASEPVEIYDSGIRYLVELLEGHKTGFFLDQRENRKRIRPFASGAEVLDVFTSDGGFALNAAFADAKSVLAIDASEPALLRTRRNASLNALQGIETECGDAFDTLERLCSSGKRFDLVILDPPSMTKSRKTIPTALKAYRKLNRLGIQLVRKGGFLATASCSHHISDDVFLDTAQKAGQEQNRFLRLLEFASQAPDHPIQLAMPETKYLKFSLFHVA